MILQPPKSTFALSAGQIKSMAAAVATDLRRAAAGAQEPPAPTGGGSRQRGLPEELRQRFIEVRTAFIQRGIFDPLLWRFDTSTVPQTTTLAIADALEKLAAAM